MNKETGKASGEKHQAKKFQKGKSVTLAVRYFPFFFARLFKVEAPVESKVLLPFLGYILQYYNLHINSFELLQYRVTPATYTVLILIIDVSPEDNKNLSSSS